MATAVFLMLVLVLASLSNQALSVWSRNEQKSDLRESARTAMSLIGSELRQAVLPVYRGDTNGLQLVVNPAGVTATNRDSIFWQAPVATSRSKGDLAIVGYFIRKADNVFKLCRLFVNPDDLDYAVYTAPNAWVNDALLNAKAPADEASNLQGVCLENVSGMWVTVYSNAVAAYTNTSFDSRVEHKLPARVEISLALLDKTGAKRVAGGVSLPAAGSYSNAASFMASTDMSIRPHMEIVTINVPFAF